MLLRSLLLLTLALSCSAVPMSGGRKDLTSLLQMNARLAAKAKTSSQLKIHLHRLRRSYEEEEMYFQKLHSHHKSLSKTRKAEHGHSNNYKVHLTDINNSQFVGEIRVGTPGQMFKVIFDTGSSNLWINGVGCTDSACLKHRRFDPAKSNTFDLLDMDMDVQFGTGSITGSLATDTFSIGAHGGLAVKNQTFGMIKEETGAVFNTGAFDGILGLSFPALSAASYTPVFDNIMEQKLLEENSFSFYYSRLPLQDSTILFGPPNREYYQGELEWVDVNHPVYWELQLKDILMDDTPMNLCPNGPCKIVVDTGTSLLTGPSGDIASLVEKVGMDYDCNDMSNLPKMTYVIVDDKGEHLLHMEPESYIIQSDAQSDDGPKYCKPGFMSLDVPEPRGPLFILGDVFMQKFFTVFSRNPARVGFAVATQGVGNALF